MPLLVLFADTATCYVPGIPASTTSFCKLDGGQRAMPAIATVAGHVAESVVNEVGSWINRHAKLLPQEAEVHWHHPNMDN
jgi:hypothetical protein